MSTALCHYPMQHAISVRFKGASEKTWGKNSVKIKYSLAILPHSKQHYGFYVDHLIQNVIIEHYVLLSK